MNRTLGVSDEWFCAGDSLVLTVLAQVWIRAPIFLLHNFYVIRFCAAHGIVITGLRFRTPGLGKWQFGNLHLRWKVLSSIWCTLMVA
jgi:hypothetical protein